MAQVIPDLLAELQHEDFALKIFGAETTGVVELSIDEDQEKEFHYGNSPHAVSYSRTSQVKISGKLELLNSAYLAIKQGLGDKKFIDVAPSDMIQIFEVDNIPQKIKFIYKNVLFNKQSRGTKVGDKGQNVSLDFICTAVLEELE